MCNLPLDPKCDKNLGAEAMRSQETEDVSGRGVYCSLMHQGESKMTAVHQLKCVTPTAIFLEKNNFRVQFTLLQINILTHGLFGEL